MRHLSDNGIPFSMEYISLNNQKQASKGLVVVTKALLRPARKTEAYSLLSYTDLTTNEPKHVHLPLIMKFNGKLLKHGN
ncbi:hypothetical protein JJL45_05165 [Tamlana sp. s12]|uniref:hypothetical protein n=1 Tax=Tamlana sp. s12 TaxID=1630406 RepID=UPI00192B095E|nr:hypothetical protein [Tamlana sp. s12]QQY83381.1 hypothetical protein JJL45_05165 [Tamlana sp. s12]